VLAIDDAVLRPLAETNRLTLRAHDVDLGQLLAALDVEGVSGEGHLAGQIPLVLSGGTIAVEGGKLETQGDGRLQIKSADAAAALAQGGADTDLLMQALSDFRYEKLALMIDKPLTGESHLSLKTLGHNPAVLDGHPFQINITVATDLDKILAGVASGGRLSQEIIRAIVGADR
jgi:adhesin HecA-like repeat protein